MNRFDSNDRETPRSSNDNFTVELRDLAKLPQLELRTKLATLRHAHGELRNQINSLRASESIDVLHVQRLKKQKLLLKDKIVAAENLLLPDIIA